MAGELSKNEDGERITPPAGVLGMNELLFACRWSFELAGIFDFLLSDAHSFSSFEVGFTARGMYLFGSMSKAARYDTQRLLATLKALDTLGFEIV